MTLKEQLVESGLTAKQAQVYLAILALGEATVLTLARKAELKRPTVYNILRELQDLGLVSKIETAGKNSFKPENPLQLINLIQEKETKTQNALPMLQAMFSQTINKPEIKVLEGAEAEVAVFNDFLEAKEIRLLGAINIPASKLKKISQKDILIKELVSLTEGNEGKTDRSENANYQRRMVPDELPFFVDCAIYNNKMTIFSSGTARQVIIIEDKKLAESFRNWHELAWRGARQIEPRP